MYYNTTTVGFFDAMGQKQVDYILNQTEMCTILCSSQYLPKIIDMKKVGLAGMVKNLVMMDDVPQEQIQAASEYNIQVYSMKDVILSGEKEQKVQYIEPAPEDYYIFSYTSGTTGDSKGVKLSHRNILVNSLATLDRLPANPGDTAISYLPMTHSFEQANLGAVLVKQLAMGFYQGDPLKLTEDCQMLKPVFFPSVPRLYNRIYGKLTSTFADATGCKKWLIDKAVNSKLHYLKQNGAVTHGCYDKLVFGKTAAVLGGQVRLMVTGSAPIDKTVLEFLKIAFCCPVLEGYGLTESSAGSCITDAADTVSGHVGGPTEYVKFRLKDLPEMDYRIDDKPYPRGECQMIGPSIFDGYFKRPDKTAECIDEEGWFSTGDVVVVYPNGALKIVDRSKNIFKLSQGEYIAPEKIENVFVLSPFVGMSLVYGNSLKNNVVAVVYPDPAAARAWAAKNGGESDFETICKDENFKKEVMADLIALATKNKLSSLEKPKDIFITSEEFTIENELLTPTFKLKRNVAAKVFEE
jgi:long-chain acyl-CoA synthetase